MPQYLVCNYMPDDFDPSTVTEAMMEEIHALNREMIAAGVRKFACGIAPPNSAKTLRKQTDGKVSVTDGPYTETKEHMGGFWILECADMDEALAFLERSPYGNQASLFTSSGAAARRFRYEAPAGNIGINIGVAAPMAYFPFSGWKDSFFGIMHAQGHDAIEFYTEKKIVVERWAKDHSRKF